MSRTRTIALLLTVFAILFFLDPSGKRDVIPTKTLLERHRNQSVLLDGLHFNTTSNFREIEDELSRLFNLSTHELPHAFYKNVTGFFKGRWEVAALNETLRSPDFNQTLATQRRGDFNFNDVGMLTYHLRANETTVPSIRMLEGNLWLENGRTSGGGLEIFVYGLHFINEGAVYLTGAADGAMPPLIELPRMMQTNASFAAALNATIGINNYYIGVLENELLENEKDEQEVERSSSSTKCQFSVFMQIRPVPHIVNQSDIDALEQELWNPEGISTIRPPALISKSLVYSPDCGILLSASKSKGVKIEVYHRKAVNYTIFATIVVLAELYLTIKQMDYTSSQSALSKVSLISIGMQSVIDAYFCLIHLFTAILIPQLFLPFATVGFLKFALFSLFEMRYLLIISRAQRRENDDSILGILYSQFSIYMFLGLFVVYQFTSKFPILIAVLGFFSYSFWIPQIVLNIMRNSRRPYLTEYIVGVSLLRLAIPLYAFGCSRSIVSYTETYWWTLLFFAGYVSVQVAVLVAQDRFGPRSFFPEHWLPRSYDYHPVLASPEAGQDVADNTHDPPLESVEGAAGESHLAPPVASASGSAGSSSGSASTSFRYDPKGKGKQRMRDEGHGHPVLKNGDCAICFLPVDYTSSPGKPLSTRMTTRLNYMLTPCHHIYHTDCLERWMEVKLECPVCRTPLPPI
ncbi:uncharacterized protein BJ171DRAFT_488636 [Polychytrium aggregatum]|uniref:uncharacterized protein n=1 Tax=Polychytrium aggregatum TaxID=110093 RepID=UPI0022FEB0DE|nr:uncharacterized protein BJ171DRAFT_488636 [Polychytrium aggregatum]KAI9209146.1 hypothetical protein BJ171DRAFT_488636 [Polychytrium aggregatum]